MIEAVGADATIVDAVSCAAPGGTISVVGVNLTMDLAFPMAIVLLKSLTLRAVFAPIPGTWPFLVPLLQSGRLSGLARDVHPPDGPEPGARGLRVVRFASRRGLEGLVDAEPLSAFGLVRRAVEDQGELRHPSVGRAMNHGAGGGTMIRVKASTIGS